MTTEKALKLSIESWSNKLYGINQPDYIKKLPFECGLCHKFLKTKRASTENCIKCPLAKSGQQCTEDGSPYEQYATKDKLIKHKKYYFIEDEIEDLDDEIINMLNMLNKLLIDHQNSRRKKIKIIIFSILSIAIFFSSFIEIKCIYNNILNLLFGMASGYIVGEFLLDAYYKKQNRKK